MTASVCIAMEMNMRAVTHFNSAAEVLINNHYRNRRYSESATM